MKISMKFKVFLSGFVVLLFLAGIVVVPHYILPYAPQVPQKSEIYGEMKLPKELRELKVYPLISGYVKASYGMFFSGLQGWSGVQAVYKILTDSGEETFWTPVYVFLIEHPEEGLVLYDAGLDAKQCEAGYYEGLTTATHEKNYVPVSLQERILSLGFSPEDVKHVIVSHMHEDHIGGVEAFPEAVVHISEKEWEDKERVFLGYPGLGIKATYSPTYDDVERLNVFRYTSGSFISFNQSYDLLGDGSLILLPTPGHSMGHSTLFIPQEDVSFILPGDAVYTMDHLDPEALAPYQLGEESYPVYRDSVERILKLQKSFPHCTILPSHEPSEYSTIMDKVLADGVLMAHEAEKLLDNQDSRYCGGKLLKTPSFAAIKSMSPELRAVGKLVRQ